MIDRIRPLKVIHGWTFVKYYGVHVVGDMRCSKCGQYLAHQNVLFCYHFNKDLNTNEFQCEHCFKSHPHWVELVNIEAAQKRAHELDLMRTEHTVLLQRIKDAFYEGFEDADYGSTLCSVEDCWEDSKAKEVHDALKKLWSVQ